MSINLHGAKVSALTTPPNPANQPTTTDPDGRFELEVKHSGTFRLKAENTCSEPFTPVAVTAAADGFHDAGTLRLILGEGPEPAGTDRYSITQKSPGNYKLTVKECVREIENSEFSSDERIITAAAAAAESVASGAGMITEIALPSTLRSIGEKGLENHFHMSGTLTVPRNVETIAKEAFRNFGYSNGAAPPVVVFEPGSKLTTVGNSGFMESRLKNFTLPEDLETIEAFTFFSARFSFSADFSPSGTFIIPSKVSKIGNQAFLRVKGITAVDIRSDLLAKPDGATDNFPLGNNLFQNVTGITEIKLPQAVYDSYTAAERSAIFGSITLNPVP